MSISKLFYNPFKGLTNLISCCLIFKKNHHKLLGHKTGTSHSYTYDKQNSLSMCVCCSNEDNNNNDNNDFDGSDGGNGVVIVVALSSPLIKCDKSSKLITYLYLFSQILKFPV